MNQQANERSPGADTNKTKRGTIVGKEGRSIAVRYGTAAVDVLLIRPCDFHGVPSLDEGTEIELRYTDHGDAGAWWHAFPVPVIDRIVDQNNALWEFLTASEGKSYDEKLALLRRAFPGAKSLQDIPQNVEVWREEEDGSLFVQSFGIEFSSDRSE